MVQEQSKRTHRTPTEHTRPITSDFKWLLNVGLSGHGRERTQTLPKMAVIKKWRHMYNVLNPLAPISLVFWQPIYRAILEWLTNVLQIELKMSMPCIILGT